MKFHKNPGVRGPKVPCQRGLNPEPCASLRVNVRRETGRKTEKRIVSKELRRNRGGTRGRIVLGRREWKLS